MDALGVMGCCQGICWMAGTGGMGMRVWECAGVHGWAGLGWA